MGETLKEMWTTRLQFLKAVETQKTTSELPALLRTDLFNEIQMGLLKISNLDVNAANESDLSTLLERLKKSRKEQKGQIL